MRGKCRICHVQIPLLHFLCSSRLSQRYTGEVDIIILLLLELTLRLELNQLKEMVFYHTTQCITNRKACTHAQTVIFFPDLKGFQAEQLRHVYY